ncbi:MAG: hypothetical protein WCW40_08775 [Bacteroidota bacterium]
MINTSFKLYNLHISAALVMLLILFFETVSAQIEHGTDKSIFRGAAGITVGGMQQQWVLKDSTGKKFGTLLQQSAPVAVSIPLANRLLLSVSNSGAISSFDTASSTNIVDTRVSMSYVFPGEKFWLTGGVSVPTGKTELDASELHLTTLLGQTALGYKVPMFGQGITGNVSLVYAGTLTRRMVLGVGLSYFYKGPFKPLKGSAVEYDAGDEISLNVGYDYITFGKSARFSIDVTSTYFFKDEVSGSGPVFESGPRTIATVIYNLKTESVNHAAMVRARYRLPNDFISSGKKYDASLQLEGQYSLGTQLGAKVYATLIGEGKYYTPDQIPSGITYIETGEAQIGAAGADVILLFWESVMPTLGARYALGSISIAGATYDVNGLEANVGLKISF